MVSEGQLLWTPSPEFVARSNVAQYMTWLKDSHRVKVADYEALRKWSVTDIERFWASIWDYFKVQSATPYEQVLDRRIMPGARWFEGSRVNYAEHLLRHEQKAGPSDVAFHHLTETRPLQTMGWVELADKVQVLATQLRKFGLKPGDRVVSYMPNLPETAIAMIATIAIGAIWSSAAPEFGVKTVIERFAQIEPKLLFAADGYRFGGKDFSRHAEVRSIADNVAHARAHRVAALSRRKGRADEYSRRPALVRSDGSPGGCPRQNSSSSALPTITRSGSCFRRAPPACPRRSCIAMSACWSNI